MLALQRKFLSLSLASSRGNQHQQVRDDELFRARAAWPIGDICDPWPASRVQISFRLARPERAHGFVSLFVFDSLAPEWCWQSRSQQARSSLVHNRSRWQTHTKSLPTLPICCTSRRPLRARASLACAERMSTQAHGIDGAARSSYSLGQLICRLCFTAKLQICCRRALVSEKPLARTMSRESDRRPFVWLGSASSVRPEFGCSALS